MKSFFRTLLISAISTFALLGIITFIVSFLYFTSSSYMRFSFFTLTFFSVSTTYVVFGTIVLFIIVTLISMLIQKNRELKNKK